jgi:hypothetical protein
MKNVLKFAAVAAVAMTGFVGAASADSHIANYYDHQRGVDVVARIDTSTGDVLEIITKQERD